MLGAQGHGRRSRTTTASSYLFKKNKVDVLPRPRPASSQAATTATKIKVGRRRPSTAKHVIIATGSKARAAAGRSPFDDKLDPATTTARSPSTRCPKRLGVVGAGVIGLEMGSVWRRLGLEGHGARGAARLSSARPTSRSPRKRRRSSPSRASTIELGRQDHQGRVERRRASPSTTPTPKGKAQDARSATG